MKQTFASYLKQKIAENIREYKSGRWNSIQQAIAVSYSEARKKFPRSAGARRSTEYLSRKKKSPKRRSVRRHSTRKSARKYRSK